jgi:UDP-glucuronate decarboxylase
MSVVCLQTRFSADFVVDILVVRPCKAKLVRMRLEEGGGEEAIVVTGGAGFVGSHLVDRLLTAFPHAFIIVVDNLSTGRRENLAHHLDSTRIKLLESDVCDPNSTRQIEYLIGGRSLRMIFHLACIASPLEYQRFGIETLRTCFLGTDNMLKLCLCHNHRQYHAHAHDDDPYHSDRQSQSGGRLIDQGQGLAECVFVFSSTSEVYGDPEEHPQTEQYRGCVNPVGPRACYDEGKRVAEALCMEYVRRHALTLRIARIFNTYGPRMLSNDGRVVCTFLQQAMRGERLTIYGDGQHTRSFMYVDDLIDGLLKLATLPDRSFHGPVNLGNPEEELSILQVAHLVQQLADNQQRPLVHLAPMPDDPLRRRPDISLARKVLGWEPRVSLKDGLRKMLDYLSAPQ